MLPTIAFLCLVVSVFGAPQSYTRYGYRNVGKPYQGARPVRAQPLTAYYPRYTPGNYQTITFGSQAQPLIKQEQVAPQSLIRQEQAAPQPFIRQAQATKPELGLTVDTSFGSFDLTSENGLATERSSLLPVMKALLAVMETDKPVPEDINTLMVLTRDLLEKVPEGEGLPSLKEYGFDVDAIDGFGLDALQNVGLPETGDLVVTRGGEPHIVTEWGEFPLSDLSLMTEEEREQFLPAVRAFTDILQKDNLNPNEVKELMKEVRKLDSWNLFPFNVRGTNEPKKRGFGSLPGEFGKPASLSGLGISGLSGLGGGFGGLGGLTALAGLFNQ